MTRQKQAALVSDSFFACPAKYVIIFVIRVCDLNLDEEEVLKLASLGKETNNKETIDVLKRSLVIRNKYVILYQL